MELREIMDRMKSGRLYFCDDAALLDEQMKFLDLVFEFNRMRPSDREGKQKMLRGMFAEIGENCYIETPFYANWGGKNVHFGRNVYANYNLTLVDDGEIYVGDFVLFGPNVTLATATHPIHPELRSRQAQYNLPIRIGNNVWIGAHAVVLPGVTIGDNTVIGAGSVVTRDVSAGVVAVGNPCRVLRSIGECDMKYYHQERQIDLEA